MIILDTNVLSTLMRTIPEPTVVAWLDRQPAQSVWITSITLFETRLGLALLPSGRRRQMLEAAFARLLIEELENRVLDFDSTAANEGVSRMSTGRPSFCRAAANAAGASAMPAICGAAKDGTTKSSSDRAPCD